MFNKTIGLIISIAVLYGCSEATSPDSTGDPSNKISPNASGDIPTRLPGEVYYTGYDGGLTDLSVLVSTSRTLEIEDPTIATARLETINIPEETVNAMIAELKATGETLSANRERRLKERLANPRAWRLTPLKAGFTYIKATRAPRGSTGTIRPESDWYIPELRTLVVEDYSGGLINTGKIRYEQGSAGSPACISCHNGTFESGVPSHQIGRVTEISDADAISWISTGRAGDRVFQTSNPAGHTWSFTNDSEKTATVAYLRSQQTKDIRELAQLLFDEALAEAKTENEN